MNLKVLEVMVKGLATHIPGYQRLLDRFGYSCPGGYASGVLLGAYRRGEGRIVLNTLSILDHLGAHPAADRLLLNLVDYGASGMPG